MPDEGAHTRRRKTSQDGPLRAALKFALLATSPLWLSGCSDSRQVPAAVGVHFRDLNGDGAITVACLGDSNTCWGMPAGATEGSCPKVENWCSQWAEMPRQNGSAAESEALPFHFLNFALGGATACDRPIAGDAHAMVQYEWAQDIEGKLRPDSPDISFERYPKKRPDIVVLAFGTNDFRLHVDKSAATPESIRDCYQRVMDRAGADGVVAFVATTPPARSSGDEAERRNNHVTRTNTALAGLIPDDRLIDFHRGFDDASFSPGEDLHLNHSASCLRANRARRIVEGLEPATCKPSPTPESPVSP
jgi:lysophospholipase L1-like esterase